MAGGASPGTHYAGVIDSGITIGFPLMQFAERFAGQSITNSGDFDVVTGTPNNPLAMQAGASNQNLVVVFAGSQLLAGVGAGGYPNGTAIGPGAVAVRFTQDQRAVRFKVVGVNAGTLTVRAYGRTGALVSTTALTLPNDFSSPTYTIGDVAGTTRPIAGLLLTNNDNGGIGYDDFFIETFSS